MKQHAGGSARFRARIAGVLYAIIFIAAPSGAKSATVANVSITMLCDVGVAVIFFCLFRPVNKHLSLVAAIFRLLFVVVMTANSLNYFGVLDLFNGAYSSAAFNTGYGIALVPFGVHCLMTGYLIFRSTFLPKVIGILLSLAGLAYLTFVWPPLGDRLFIPYVAVPGVVGEGALALWLIFVGVNPVRWAQSYA